MAATKLTAKEKLDAVFTSHGWEVDRTPHKTYRMHMARTQPVDGLYIKPHGPGTAWRLYAEYSEESLTRNKTRRVIAVHFGLFSTDHNHQLPSELLRVGTNETIDNHGWSADGSSWRVESGISLARKQKGFSLRQLAEWIAADPEAAVAEVDVIDAIANAERQRRRDAERLERNQRQQPLPLAEGTDWCKLRRELKDASAAVIDADGLTDLPVAVAKLLAVSERISASVLPQ